MESVDVGELTESVTFNPPVQYVCEPIDFLFIDDI